MKITNFANKVIFAYILFKSFLQLYYVSVTNIYSKLSQSKDYFNSTDNIQRECMNNWMNEWIEQWFSCRESRVIRKCR